MASSVSSNGTGVLAPAADAAADAVAAEVRRVFADLTRYPLDVLDPAADVEEELGIDSVKLGEILSVLRERFALPPTTELRGRFPVGQLRTIGGITEAVRAFAGGAGGAAAAPPAVAPASESASPAASGSGSSGSPAPGATSVPATATAAGSLADEVRQVFADLTRYPLDVLVPDADLEEELGIDSVKLGEIFSVLRERWALPARGELRDRIQPGQLRTLGGIVEIVRAFGAAGEPDAKPAPAVATSAAPSAVASPVAGPAAPTAATSSQGVSASAPAPDMRTRTLRWPDPAAGAAAAARLAGIDQLRATLRGELPAPALAAVLDYDLLEVEPGRVALEARLAEFCYEATGELHGGVAAALLGAAMDAAVRSTLPAGARASTVALELHVVRPLTADVARLRCEATASADGRHLATARGAILDEQGEVYAHGVQTCAVARSD